MKCIFEYLRVTSQIVPPACGLYQYKWSMHLHHPGARSRIFRTRWDHIFKTTFNIHPKMNWDLIMWSPLLTSYFTSISTRYGGDRRLQTTASCSRLA